MLLERCRMKQPKGKSSTDLSCSCHDCKKNTAWVNLCHQKLSENVFRNSLAQHFMVSSDFTDFCLFSFQPRIWQFCAAFHACSTYSWDPADWQLFSPARHIWQLHIRGTVVQRQGCMETRALPDLRLRQWNRHVRRGDLWGHIWVRRPHHPRGRVLPYLSRCWGYLRPPSLHHFCGFLSLEAPPSATFLTIRASLAMNGPKGAMPACPQVDFKRENNHFGSTFCHFHNRWIIPALGTALQGCIRPARLTIISLQILCRLVQFAFKSSFIWKHLSQVPLIPRHYPTNVQIYDHASQFMSTRCWHFPSLSLLL